MKSYFTAKAYPISETGVRFCTDDLDDRRIYERCERLCKENIEQYGDKPVLKEGAKYNGVWLETQPMGGEMYAKRNMEVALNNQLIFMENQRMDGRLPGMITFSLPYRGITPHYGWMQGNFLPTAALKMGYLIGKDRTYLELLDRTLRKFDEYLWNWRDSDGDGCLESWCVWDTGEDNFTQLLAHGVHAHENGLWVGESAPYGNGRLPFESAQYMAYSYANRQVLAEIARLLNTGEADFWTAQAEQIRQKLRDYLWDPVQKACFDRDCDNELIPCLSQANIKCMHLGAFTQQMADEFIATHLMNRAEFATPLPLPSIAANNPYFYLSAEENNCTPDMLAAIRRMVAGDAMDNSWSGPCEGLTYQRLPDALLRYGHHAEVGWFGRKWLDNLAATDRLVQQYHPFTGAASPGSEGYGPTMLGALEYICLMYGIQPAYDELAWSSVDDDRITTYTQRLHGHDYTLTRKDRRMVARLEERELFSAEGAVRVYTDEAGHFLRLYGLGEQGQNVTLHVNGTAYTAFVAPNEEWVMGENRLTLGNRVPFTKADGSTGAENDGKTKIFSMNA